MSQPALIRTQRTVSPFTVKWSYSIISLIVISDRSCTSRITACCCLAKWQAFSCTDVFSSAARPFYPVGSPDDMLYLSLPKSTLRLSSHHASCPMLPKQLTVFIVQQVANLPEHILHLTQDPWFAVIGFRYLYCVQTIHQQEPFLYNGRLPCFFPLKTALLDLSSSNAA